jgi:hypothetical protein
VSTHPTREETRSRCPLGSRIRCCSRTRCNNPSPVPHPRRKPKLNCCVRRGVWRRPGQAVWGRSRARTAFAIYACTRNNSFPPADRPQGRRLWVCPPTGHRPRSLRSLLGFGPSRGCRRPRSACVVQARDGRRGQATKNQQPLRVLGTEPTAGAPSSKQHRPATLPAAALQKYSSLWPGPEVTRGS